MRNISPILIHKPNLGVLGEANHGSGLQSVGELPRNLGGSPLPRDFNLPKMNCGCNERT
jgi:hypothetical protein